MRRVVLIVVLALAATGAAAAVALAREAAPGAPGGSAGPRLGPFLDINFVSTCRFSHRAPDDPIVFPGQPGASHDHSFFGNVSTSAASTVESLRAAGTTCQRPGDTAAYWVPTLFANGQPVEPLAATIYYRRRTIERVRAFPTGLKVIAGEPHSTSPQDRSVTFWSCGGEGGVPPSSEPPTCPDAGRASGLRLHVRFPSCWDGENLDSADHQSHMAYAVRGRCPASHPVEVPAVTIVVRYPIAGGGSLELASGGVYSGHADFFNAWDQGALTRLVSRCLNALRHCGRSL